MIFGRSLVAFCPAVILLAALPTSAATEAQRSSTYRQCIATGDAAEGVTVAIHNCLADEWAKQDAALNTAYKVRVAVLPSARKVALRDAQRRWIKRRDAICQKAAAPDGDGTIVPLIIDDCHIDQTIDRTAIINGFK
jgi:uncharacterized protein YecT (DUF1311 family)